MSTPQLRGEVGWPGPGSSQVCVLGGRIVYGPPPAARTAEIQKAFRRALYLLEQQMQQYITEKGHWTHKADVSPVQRHTELARLRALWHTAQADYTKLHKSYAVWRQQSVR
jgi:hypothetical protein